MGHLVTSSLQSKTEFVIHLYPLKFGCPKPKSSCPKRFVRFLSQLELRKQMKWPRYDKVKRIIYPYFVKHEVFFYDYKINFKSTVILSHFSNVSVFFLIKICLSHEQVMSKVYMSPTIGNRFWHILQCLSRTISPFE